MTLGRSVGDTSTSTENGSGLEVNVSALEKQIPLKSVMESTLVAWEGPDDPENPKNWSYKRKWAATLIVSSFAFISPVSSSMVAPALDQIRTDLKMSSELEVSMVLSIFILAYAVGPLFLAPLSEIYGRVIILQLSNMFFLAFNIGCGFAQTKGQLIAFRFLSGLGGSAPLALGGGLLSDCFRPEERGKSMSVYSVAPLLGPAIGPIAGGFIAYKTTWRWCFWSASIVDLAIQVLGLIYLQETYAPKLLSRKARRLRKETGNLDFHTEWETPDRTLSKVLKSNLVRPLRLLTTQPIIQVLALYMAYVYGIMYLVLTTFPRVWTDIYHEFSIGGLNYISLGVGFFLGTQICASVNDRIYIILKKRNNNVGKPEFRIPLMVPGMILVPVGLFIYGWTSYEHLHWIVPNIGAALFAAGTMGSFQCILSYIVDAYSRFAASAFASVIVLRSFAGFAFPLFAPYLYNALGLNWGNSLLGFIAVGLGIPAPFLLWKFGERIRAKSLYAAG